MHLAGRKVQELYETLKNQKKKKKRHTEYEDAIAKFNDFFAPRRNSTYERHVFRQIKQGKDEKFGLFLTRLRKQADRCDFGKNAEDNLKYQIIEKCQSSKLRKDLLKLGDVDLRKVMKVANAFEAVAEQEKDFDRGDPKGLLSFDDVCSVESRSKFMRSGECTRCGFRGHQSNDDQCPAKEKRCNTCGGHDHFSRKCHTKVENSNFVKKRPLTEDFSSKPSQKKPKSEEVVEYVAEEDDYEF